MDAHRIEGIQMRVDAVPGGDWRCAIGSGNSAMTAVVADLDDEGSTAFIADVLPDYKVSDTAAWENRVALLRFIENAPSDIRFMLGEIARLTAERDALRAAADAAYWWNAAAHTVRETARANGAEWVAEQIEQHRERIAAALGDYKPEHVA